jgi:hypothetical protein
VGRWKHYEDEYQSIVKYLQPFLAAYGYL